MSDELRQFNALFEEGTLAFSDRILGLTSDELWENENDEDVETALTFGDFRESA